MVPRKDWSQILAEGAEIKIGEETYELAPLTNGEFGEFIAAMKNRQILAFEGAANPGMLPTLRAEVMSKILLNAWSDSRVIEVACTLEGAPWILRRSLEKGGAKNATGLVDNLSHGDLIDKAGFVLELSGLCTWRSMEDTGNPPEAPETTGGKSSES